MRSMILIPINGITTPPNPKMNRLRLNKADAPIGLYATPFNANGINIGMIIALKITADKIALSGL